MELFKQEPLAGIVSDGVELRRLSGIVMRMCARSSYEKLARGLRYIVGREVFIRLEFDLHCWAEKNKEVMWGAIMEDGRRAWMVRGVAVVCR
jgi:hypothetical protein